MSKMLVSVVFLAAFGYAQAAEKPSLTVTTPNDVVNPDDGLISLREAFNYAQADKFGTAGALSEEGGYRITFDYAKLGTDTVTLTDGPIELETSGGNWEGKKIYIDGTLDPGSDLETNAGDTIVTISGGGITFPKASWNIDLAYVRFVGCPISVTGGNVVFTMETCEASGCDHAVSVNASDDELQAVVKNSTIYGNSNFGATFNAMLGSHSSYVLVLDSTFYGNKYYGLKVDGAADALIANTTFAGNNFENNAGNYALDLSTSGDAYVYSTLAVSNGTGTKDIGCKAGTLTIESSLYGLIEGTENNANVTAAANTIFASPMTLDQIFKTTPLALEYYNAATPSKKALTKTLLLNSGATPSIAGGLGQWVRYTTSTAAETAGKVTSFQVAYDRKVASNWETVWGEVQTGDVPSTLTLDQNERSFASNLPSAGACWTKVEVPSLVVTTMRDTIDGSDGETSLREALAYARRLGGPDVRQITFDYDKLMEEAAHLPDGWDAFTIYLGKSFDPEAATPTVVDGLNAATPLEIDGNVEILGGINDWLCVKIDGIDMQRDVFSVTDGSRARVVSMEVKRGKTGFVVNGSSVIYFDDMSIHHVNDGVIAFGDNSVVFANGSSFYNVQNTAVYAGKNITLLNTTAQGSVSSAKGDVVLADATVVGNVSANVKFQAANSIVNGTVTGGSVWARHSAFSSALSGVDTTNYTGVNLGLSEIQIYGNGEADSRNNKGYYTFSKDVDWAKNGTIIAAFNWDWTTATDAPTLHYGGRVNWNVPTSSSIVPEDWVAYAFGDNNNALYHIGLAILSDEVAQLRLPNAGYITMGAWTAYRAVAWKSLQNPTDAADVLGAGGYDHIDRNNYYDTVQSGVNNLAATLPDGKANELYEGKPALYLWGTEIANDELESYFRRVYISNDMSLVGQGANSTKLTSDSTNGRAILVNENVNVILAGFEVSNCAHKGIEISTGASAKLNDVAVLNNADDGIRAYDGAGAIELVNTTVAGNKVGLSGLVQWSLYDVTVSTNGIGVWGGGTGTLTLVNSIVLGNNEDLNSVTVSNNLYSITSGSDQATIFDYGNADINIPDDAPGYTPWGSQIWIAYASRAGWQGTKIAKDDNGDWYYLDRGNSDLTAVAKENWQSDRSQWQWKKVSDNTVASNPSALEIINVDQVGRTRLAAEDVGFNEYAIGAFAPSVSIKVQLMTQLKEYASRHLEIEPTDAIFAIRSAMADQYKASGSESVYYNTADGKLYTTFTQTLPTLAFPRGSYPTTPVSGEVAGTSGFIMTANVSPVESGRQIHVRKNSEGTAYDGYDTTFEDVHIFFGSTENELTDAYAISLVGVDPVAESENGGTFPGYAELYIVPRNVTLSSGITKAKYYDGTPYVHITTENLEHAGVLNAEVSLGTEPGITYASAHVDPALVTGYTDNGNVVPQTSYYKLIWDPNFSFVGAPTYLEDYVVVKEDLYAVILPKPVTVDVVDFVKQYDGTNIVANASTIAYKFTSTDNDGVAQESFLYPGDDPRSGGDCLPGAVVSGSMSFNGGTDVTVGPDVTVDGSNNYTATPYPVAQNDFTVVDSNNSSVNRANDFAFTFDSSVDVGIQRRVISYFDHVQDRPYDGTVYVYTNATQNYAVPQYSETGVTRFGKSEPEKLVIKQFNNSLASYEIPTVQGSPVYNTDTQTWDGNSVYGQDLIFNFDSENQRSKYYKPTYGNIIEWEGINGANINNYEVDLHVNSRILPRILSLTSITGKKDYDGSKTNLVVDAYTFDTAAHDDVNNRYTGTTGIIPGEMLGLSGTGATSTQRDATGTGTATDTTTWSDLTLSGIGQGDAINYWILPTTTMTSTIDIDPRPITLYFHAVKTYDGTTDVKYMLMGAKDGDTVLPVSQDYTYQQSGAWKYIVETSVLNDDNDNTVPESFSITASNASYASPEANDNIGNDYISIGATAFAGLTGGAKESNYAFTIVKSGAIAKRPLGLDVGDQEIVYGDPLSLDGTYALFEHNGFTVARYILGASYGDPIPESVVDLDSARAAVASGLRNNSMYEDSDMAMGYNSEEHGRFHFDETESGYPGGRWNQTGNVLFTFDGEVELAAGPTVFFVDATQKNSVYAGDDVRDFRVTIYGNGQVYTIDDSMCLTFDGNDGHRYRYNWATNTFNVAQAGTYKLHVEQFSRQNGYFIELAYTNTADEVSMGADLNNPDLTGFTGVYAKNAKKAVPASEDSAFIPAYYGNSYHITGSDSDWTWQPAENNVIRDVVASVTGNDSAHDQNNNCDCTGTSAVLTDAAISTKEVYGQAAENAATFAAGAGATLEWTLSVAKNLKEFRFYTAHEDSNGTRAAIYIGSIQVKHTDGTWETIDGSTFNFCEGYGDLVNTVEPKNTWWTRRVCRFYSANGAAIATDVTAIKVTIANKIHDGYIRFAEIEAIGAPTVEGSAVNKLATGDVFSVTLGVDSGKISMSSSDNPEVGTHEEAILPTGSAIVNASSQNRYTSYDIAVTKGDLVVTARPATVTVDGTKFWKVYDGTTAVRPIDENSALGNTITGDDISIAGSFAYDTANIGTGHTITMSGITKSGVDSGNYTVPETAYGEDAVIDTLYISDPAQTPILIGSTWLNNNIPIYANTAYATNPNILHDVVEAINVTNSNGVTAWQSYVLGFNDKSGMLWIDTEQYNDTSKILAHYNTLAPVAASGYTPKFALVTREKAGGYSESVGGIQAANTKFDIATGSNDPTGHYEINAYFYSNNGNLKYLGMTDDQKAAIQDADENLAYCKSVNTLGILKAASTNHQEMIAIPWKQLAPNDDQYILVENIVQTANLTAGDQLYVYRPNDTVPEGVPTSLGGGYSLVWYDEFNYTGAPDPQKWVAKTETKTFTLGEGSAKVTGTLIHRAQNAYCEDGNLVLKQECDTGDSMIRYDAQLLSWGLMNFKHGRIVVRFKDEVWPGMRPEIAYLSNEYGLDYFNAYSYYHDWWPENDTYAPGTPLVYTYMESAAMSSWQRSDGRYEDQTAVMPEGWNSDYHDLVIDWEHGTNGDTVKYSIDGTEYMSRSSIAGVDVPNYLMLSYGPNEYCSDPVNNVGIDSHYLLIDYVRVYQKDDGHSEIESTVSFDRGVYDCYLLDAEKKWSSITSYKLDAFGKLTTRTATAPEYARIPRGSAAWLVRGDNTKPIYFAGQVNTNETVTTTVERGSVSAPKWTMLGSPSINEPFDIATITEGVVATTSASQFMDQIVVHRDGVDKIYTYENGHWGYWTTETFTRFGKTGTRSVYKTDDTVIPVGTAFWYVSRGGSPTITWRLVPSTEESGSGEGN